MRARMVAYAVAALAGWTVALVGFAAYVGGRDDDLLALVVGFAVIDGVLMTVAFLMSLLNEAAEQPDA